MERADQEKENQSARPEPVDRAMLESIGLLTPQERIENHQAALNFVHRLKSSGERYYAESQRNSKKTSTI